MLEGLIDGLIVAWILSWFGVDEMILEVIQPFVNVQLTSSHYYVAIGMIGLIGGAINRYR